MTVRLLPGFTEAERTHDIHIYIAEIAAFNVNVAIAARDYYDQCVANGNERKGALYVLDRWSELKNGVTS